MTDDVVKKSFVLRTCDVNLRAHGGFQWPESGFVECPDWNPEPKCGHGLHGLLKGCGDAATLGADKDAKWLVVEVNDEDIVDLGGKVKFSRGNVVFCGDRSGAVSFLVDKHPDLPIVFKTITNLNTDVSERTGDYGTTIVGDRSFAYSGHWGVAWAGRRGTAIAGINGDACVGDNGMATVGDRGVATVGYGGGAFAGTDGIANAGHHARAEAGSRARATSGNFGVSIVISYSTATSGHHGKSVSGDFGTSVSGEDGTAITGRHGHAQVGTRGFAQAGEHGSVQFKWWDGKRYRTSVFYVGEDGMEPDVRYECVDGKLVKKVVNEMVDGYKKEE